MFGQKDVTGLTSKFTSILRYYSRYQKMHAFLRKSQWWSEREIEEYQTKEVQKLLSHAYQHVPYYHNLFDTINLKPGDVRTLDDLDKIPFLTRDLIKEHINELKATNFPDSARVSATTGGSSGIPLSFYLPTGTSRAYEWAFMKTQWERVGYKMWDKCVVLRGNRAGNGLEVENRISKTILFGRWLVLSPYHLNEENYQLYIDKLRKFKPRYIQAYPSLIVQLAKYMIDKNLPPIDTLNAVLCGSEGMTLDQRKLIERAFHCRVFSWYGHSEMCVLAGECDYSTDYHIFPEYGVTELVNEDNNIIKKSNMAGEIVSTSLTNYVFPLIRYKTSDIGVYADGPCKCGRNCRRFARIEGRLQDVIVTSDFRKITLTSLIFAQHFHAFSHLKAMQVVQNEVGKIIIRIIPSEIYSPADEEEILEKILSVTDNKLLVGFEYVDSICRTKSGKYIFLIQNINVDM